MLLGTSAGVAGAETGIYTIATLFPLCGPSRAFEEMAVTGCALLADSTAAFAAAVVGTLYLLGGRRKFGRQESE